jgi:chromosome segregation ATPase
MKNIAIVALLATVIVLLFHYTFSHQSSFDIRPYKKAIDSLQVKIDSVSRENKALVAKGFQLEAGNSQLEFKIQGLKGTIKSLKSDSSKIKVVYSYSPNQLDSFFLSKYKKLYSEPTKDTTRLPIPVSKEVVIDLENFDRATSALAKTDSLVQLQSTLIQGKDSVIINLKAEQSNWNFIVSSQSKQQDDYKVQIDGLDKDLKKYKRSTRIQRIKTILLGAAVAALLIAHK